MSPNVPVVHVVDDDPSFLKAVARLLRASGFPVLTFDSADSFLARLNPGARGCVVVDLRMPVVSGLELQDALARRDDSMPVVFFTGDGDIQSSVRAMRRGAEDFLCKQAPKEEMLDAVRRALSRDARQCTLRDQLQALRARFDSLTPRDREVLDHVLRGRLNKQIAHDLGIDERSVKRHRTSIMTRLGVESVPELMDLVHAARLNESVDDRDNEQHETSLAPRP